MTKRPQIEPIRFSIDQIRQRTMQQAITGVNSTQGLQDGIIISEMKHFMTHSIDIAPPTTVSCTKVTQYQVDSTK